MHNVVFLSAVVESGHVKGSMGLAMRTNVSLKECGGQGMLDITLWSWRTDGLLPGQVGSLPVAQLPCGVGKLCLSHGRATF